MSAIREGIKEKINPNPSRNKDQVKENDTRRKTKLRELGHHFGEAAGISNLIFGEKKIVE